MLKKTCKSNFDLIYSLEDRGERFDAPGENNYRIPQHDCRTFINLRSTGDEEYEYVLQGLAKLEANVTGNEGEG